MHQPPTPGGHREKRTEPAHVCTDLIPAILVPNSKALLGHTSLLLVTQSLVIHILPTRRSKQDPVFQGPLFSHLDLC